MARIDVSELLSDPDFTDTITVVRIAETVDSHGTVQRSETLQASLEAVVQAGGGEALARLEDGSRISDSIYVWAQFPLRAANPGGQPADEIIWQGNRYVVKISNDWSNWGEGYYRGTCEFLGASK